MGVTLDQSVYGSPGEAIEDHRFAGGVSWESTVSYYRWINQAVKRRLGRLHSAKIVLVSVDFQAIETLQHAGRWDEAGEYLAVAARQAYLRIMASLGEAGAEGIILGCTEIAMLVEQQHTEIALFDTTAIHAEAAVERALESY